MVTDGMVENCSNPTTIWVGRRPIVGASETDWNRSPNVVSCSRRWRRSFVGGIWEPGFLCWSSQFRPGTMSGSSIPSPSACVLVKIKLTSRKNYYDQFPWKRAREFSRELSLAWTRGKRGRGNHDLVTRPTLPLITGESPGNVLQTVPASAPAYNSQWKTAVLSKWSHALNSTTDFTLFIVLVYWAFTTLSLCR